MKKVISLCMALMLLLTAFPISANAYPAEYTEPDSCSGTYYNIDWRYDKDTKTMYFTDNGSKEKAVPAVKPDFYLYESSDAAIWAEIDWRPAYPWYSKNTYIANFAEHIVINSSITDVIDYMCYKFTKITEINVPNSVKSIGKSAFSGSTKLESISLPENIEDIDGSSLSSTAYYNNDENWQDNILYYGDICLLHRMFKTSENTSVKEGTRVIANGAFTYYQNSEITLPEGVKIIGNQGIFKNEHLRHIYSYKPSAPVTKSFYQTQDELKKAVGTVYNSLPEGLEEIGSDAIYWNRSLDYMYIPSSVKKIGHHCFWDSMYKDNGEVFGLKVINVALDEESFKNNCELGESWLPEYNNGLFNKKAEVKYAAQRE